MAVFSNFGSREVINKKQKLEYKLSYPLFLLTHPQIINKNNVRHMWGLSLFMKQTEQSTLLLFLSTSHHAPPRFQTLRLRQKSLAQWNTPTHQRNSHSRNFQVNPLLPTHTHKKRRYMGLTSLCSFFFFFYFLLHFNLLLFFIIVE